MKIELQFKDYSEQLSARSNHALSMELVLKPFGLGSPNKDSSDYLLVGHLLDHLAETYKSDDVVDLIDIADAAAELGLEGAEGFLELAPLTMFQILRAHLE